MRLKCDELCRFNEKTFVHRTSCWKMDELNKPYESDQVSLDSLYHTC